MTPLRPRLGALMLVGLLLAASPPRTAAERPRLLLDADTANEIDDMYAIVRMSNQDRFEVVALTSAQWFHYMAAPHLGPDETTVDTSQRYNEELLGLLGRTDLPAPKGSVEPFGVPWGGKQPKDSEAAQAIIRHARATPDGERLTVVCLGASTNLASAIALAPDIASRIDAHVLGFRYDVERRVWNKSSFNVRRDLNAADYLLDCEELELHIMPANVARPLTFERNSTWSRHERLGELGAYLTRKWKERFANFETWVMWDLALVEALIRPELATEERRLTPPENTQREVGIYTQIDERAMRDDYWRVVESSRQASRQKE